MTQRTLRRPGLLASGILALGVAGLLLTTVAARPAETAATNHEAWLDALKGKHRQLFDSPLPAGGIPLVHIMNYLDTYNAAYGVADRDINAIGTFYGATTFYGVNDAMWAKYRLGEFLETTGPDGAPATANPWRKAPVVLGMTLEGASIEALQKRGTTFIVCNNALQIFTALLAQQRGLDAKVVYQDMKANILPGATLVPAMVVAIEKVQERGIAYHRQ